MIDVPADVHAHLVDRGFGSHGALPAVAVDIAELRDSSFPSGYEFVRVGDADSDEWVRQFAIGYELPLGVASCFAPSGRDDQDAATQFFAVRKDGAIVGTSVCFL